MNGNGTYRTRAITATVLAVEAVAWLVGIAFVITAWRYLPQFKWEHRDMLWLLLAGPLLTLAYLVGIALKNRALHRFAQASLIQRLVPGVSSWRSALRFLFLRHAFSFAIFALAGPLLGTRIEEITTQGVDVVVAIDVSNSMLAEDLKPDRLQVAKRALQQLTDRLGGDRLGLVVFAGQAYTQLPLTADRSAAKIFINTLSPDLVKTQGTAVGAAIDQARQSFDGDAATSKAIIVISDGESFEDDGVGAAKRAAAEGIVVNTIGMGTVQGAPIPVVLGGRRVGFKKDKDSQTVITKLNPTLLEQVAAAGNGKFVQATSAHTGVNEMLNQLRGMDQSQLGSYTFAGHENRYAYPLAIACLLTLLGMLTDERASKRKWRSARPWNA